MSLRVVSHFYVTYLGAVRAMADLVAAGVADANISLIESEDDARLPPEVSKNAAQAPASAGATLGASIGGGLGVLIGVGAISVPFFDPVGGLGWALPTIIGALIGAVAGAGLGIVTRMGVRNRQAHFLAAGLQRGEYLVMVRVEDSRAPEVEAILARSHVVPSSPPNDPAAEGTPAAIYRGEKRIQYGSE